MPAAHPQRAVPHYTYRRGRDVTKQVAWKPAIRASSLMWSPVVASLLGEECQVRPEGRAGQANSRSSVRASCSGTPSSSRSSVYGTCGFALACRLRARCAGGWCGGPFARRHASRSTGLTWSRNSTPRASPPSRPSRRRRLTMSARDYVGHLSTIPCISRADAASPGNQRRARTRTHPPRLGRRAASRPRSPCRPGHGRPGPR